MSPKCPKPTVLVWSRQGWVGGGNQCQAAPHSTASPPPGPSRSPLLTHPGIHSPIGAGGLTAWRLGGAGMRAWAISPAGLLPELALDPKQIPFPRAPPPGRAGSSLHPLDPENLPIKQAVALLTARFQFANLRSRHDSHLPYLPDQHRPLLSNPPTYTHRRQLQQQHPHPPTHTHTRLPTTCRLTRASTVPRRASNPRS